MQLTCPKDKAHKKFYATAHVTEEWVVNEEGDFDDTVSNGESEVVHRPDSEDLFTCRDCGATAEATE